MKHRLFIIIGLLCVLGLASGSHPAHADTDPGCPVVETGTANRAIGYCATVSGGQINDATDDYGTVGGGAANQAGDNEGTTDDKSFATVGGGHNNRASGESATVGGGQSNRASASYATIAGGGLSDQNNTGTGNRVTDNYGTVGGGGNNQAGDNAGVTTDRIYATVAGGQSNTASGAFATVGGGDSNRALGTRSTVAGGFANLASTTYATVAGGYANRAQGAYATVPGGSSNVATGANSFAAGTRAKANHQGTFVWGDNTATDIASTANNQFIARASGGVKFFSNTKATAGVELPAGGGAWSSLSDRAAKTNIVAVDGKAVLEKLVQIPIEVWNYKTQDASVRHIGPMAQDFAAAFGVGEDDRHISTVDADGVALAAIQGLNQKVEAKDAAIKALQTHDTAMQARIAELEQAMRTRSTTSAPSIIAGGFWRIALLVSGGLIMLLLGVVIGLLLRRPVRVA